MKYTNTWNRFYLGQLIEYKAGYALKAHQRFEIGEDKKGKLTKSHFSGSGYVIGVRRAIMEEYVYIPGWTDNAGSNYAESVQASATGKYEECLLITQKIKPYKPILIRLCDVV